jgi:hypothetical protein
MLQTVCDFGAGVLTLTSVAAALSGGSGTWAVVRRDQVHEVPASRRCRNDGRDQRVGLLDRRLQNRYPRAQDRQWPSRYQAIISRAKLALRFSGERQTA